MEYKRGLPVPKMFDLQLAPSSITNVSPPPLRCEDRLNFSPDPRRVEEDARANSGWEGSEVDHVIGATAQHGTVYYLVKW